MTKKKIMGFEVETIEDTISKILKDKVSVTRLGEGEFRWMCGDRYNSFQDYSEQLKKRLIEVVSSDNDNLMICIPPVLASESSYGQREHRHYWEYILGKEGKKWGLLLDKSKIYHNAFFTRIYILYQNREESEKYFGMLKKIWDSLDVLIVEGAKTRLGVGNDLLSNAKSIQRIIAPAVNAFEKYDDIYKCTLDAGSNRLILLALGPTASILAYDLAKEGLWAIDIGHIDVEYEWFRMAAKKKVPVKGKYVNEAGGMHTFVEFEEDILREYKSEIIQEIS